jgi:ubiquinone/menaquinone biosynthesis C-methylase UbiE
MPALPRGDTTAAASWTLFERGAENYEQWYATRRGRRADRAERALLVSLLRPFAGAQTALEVGCGTGHFTTWLSGRQIRIVGLDRSPAMLTVARRRLPELPLVMGDAHRLPVREKAVDVVVFVTTLEFLDDPGAALAEAVRVSRRGVLVLVLNRWSPGGLSRRCGPQAWRSRLGRAHDFTLPSLRALAVHAAGERLLDCRWASTLFPDGLADVVAAIPVGDVIGVAVALRP